MSSNEDSSLEIHIDEIKEDNDEPTLYIDISHIIEGKINTSIGSIKRIKTKLSNRDILQDWHARWKVKRDNFRVPTGLYAIGNPDKKSPVLVTANYKLTLDKLRKELTGLNLWIMIIDTKGINVWCAAGKGTFGTEEIIYRIEKLKLKELVSHRNIILPQLGAPGVSAHEVTKHTGFRVLYGPVRAEDIPQFISNDFHATENMRRVSFGLVDRTILTPMEILLSFRYIPIVLMFFVVLNYIGSSTNEILSILRVSLFNSLAYIGAFIIGAFIIPVLLPYVPFKSFSLKGLILGVLWSIFVAKFNNLFLFDSSFLVSLGNTLILTSISAVLSLNFTGSTTYTSFSGVQKETLWTIPIAIFISLAGVGLLVTNQII